MGALLVRFLNLLSQYVISVALSSALIRNPIWKNNVAMIRFIIITCARELTWKHRNLASVPWISRTAISLSLCSATLFKRLAACPNDRQAARKVWFPRRLVSTKERDRWSLLTRHSRVYGTISWDVWVILVRQMYYGEPGKGGCELNLRPCNRSVREGRSWLLEGDGSKGRKGNGDKSETERGRADQSRELLKQKIVLVEDWIRMT